jgi:flagellar biosynthesis protein FliR
MRIAALLVALFAIVVGVVGIFTPDSLTTIGRYVVTPVGLYVIAAVRVAGGLVLMLVAPNSRVPRTLRVVGAVVLVAGLVTPLFGVERARAILDWESTQGSAFIRVVAGLVLAAGGFVAFAVTGRRPKNRGA